MLQRILRSIHSRAEGQVLVLFAGGLVAFLGLVGMSIDVGRVMYTRTDLQKIADAGALAGAQDLPLSVLTATSTANSYSSKNGSATIAVSFYTTTLPSDTIQVVASRHVSYNFLKFVGLSGADVSAKARAKGAQSKSVTGYNWNNIAPFVIWGGSRKSEVNAGDKKCDFHVCAGSSYTFLDVGWFNKSGQPTSPDWTASNSNNFKGDINHGAGSPVSEIGDTFSDGGLGSVVVPLPGTTIVVPIVNKAADGSSLRTFRIAAWAIITVNAGCTKNNCTGTVQSPIFVGAKPPPGYSTAGSVPPPPTLDYKAPPSTTLIQ